MKTIRWLVPLVFFLFIAGFSGSGQENKSTILPDIKPVFPGGEEALKHNLAENIAYPVRAKENDIAGKVFVDLNKIK